MDDFDKDAEAKAREERALEGDDKHGGSAVGWVALGAILFLGSLILWLVS